MRKHFRAIAKIKETIDHLDVDLTNEVVLTEVGSGNYIYSPIIPVLAGAEKVFAWVQDSRFGSARDIISECSELIEELGLESKVEFYNGSFNAVHLATATIITNSGFLRPLNRQKLEYVNQTAVIPLMYEAWELRTDDLDLDFASNKGIKVAGTWENHPQLNVFDFVGSLSIKLALQAGFEIRGNHILVWSDDDFGEFTSKAFTDFGASTVVQTIKEEDIYVNADCLDFIFLCDYSEERKISDIWSFEHLRSLNAGLGLVHLYGQLDYKKSMKYFNQVFPAKDGRTKVMSETLSYLGFLPLIKLLTAGYKVAEAMRKESNHNLVQPINY
ncbi:hypothetical protein [Roseivirga seohaensis]|uniref:hypothetical protein n=1 Tax=Roseivirga seohaensis TaxID=1914963 RepID=UPI003BAB582D